jgi:hypothetical protein
VDYTLVKLKSIIEYDKFLEISVLVKTVLMTDNSNYKYMGSQNMKKLTKDWTNGAIPLSLLNMGNLESKKYYISLTEAKIYYAISTLFGQSECPVMSDEKMIAFHCGASVN